MSKILSNIFIILALGIIQVSFLSTWPEPINSLNIILVLVIFLPLIDKYEASLILALGCGLFLELFSLDIFGLVIIALFISVVMVNLLFKNLFTNYSFYSLTILGIVGTLTYNLFLLFGRVVFGIIGEVSLIGLFSLGYFKLLFWHIILNLIILYVIFFVFQLLNSKLKVTNQ